MSDRQEQPSSNSIEKELPRKPYQPPTLKRLGTVQQLTQTIPGNTPADNDPFTPGSTF